MKRIALFVLPIVSTFVVVGLGLLLLRTQTATLRPRLVALRAAVGRVVEDVEEEVGETLEEVLE